MKIAVTIAVLALIAAPSAGSAQAAFRGRILDSHVHLNDPAKWVSLMDEADIGWAVTFAGRSVGNTGLLEAAAQWPGRFKPFLSVSPEFREFRTYWERDDTALVAIADSLLRQGGFYGIGEISISHFPSAGFPEADFSPNGRVARGMFALARKYGIPVTVHVEITRLRELEAILTEYRDVTVIWAHGGYTPLFLAQRMIDQHPNLIYELSARTWAHHPRSPDYTILRDGVQVWPEWIALVERSPERFIVGTDAAGRSVDSDRSKLNGMASFLGQLTPRAAALVASANLQRILRSN